MRYKEVSLKGMCVLFFTPSLFLQARIYMIVGAQVALTDFELETRIQNKGTTKSGNPGSLDSLSSALIYVTNHMCYICVFLHWKHLEDIHLC